MVSRETFPTDHENYTITIATEQLGDAGWAAVATVTRFAGGAEQVTQVPLPDERFDTMAHARDFALERARHWIDENAANESGDRAASGRVLSD
jgi:hypothetical protein